MATISSTQFFSSILLISLILLTNTLMSFAESNIRIISDLPKDSDPCYVGVKPIDTDRKIQDFALLQGEEAEIKAANNIYTAVFQWKDKEGEVEAYDPKRDAGKNNVYWKISSNGFFFGYDEANVTNKASKWQIVNNN